MKENKLKVKWNKKEKDIESIFPLGRMTQCDANYLLTIFNDEFVQEMKNRGYDITTLKFEITVDENNTRYNEKFSALSQGKNSTQVWNEYLETRKK